MTLPGGDRRPLLGDPAERAQAAAGRAARGGPQAGDVGACVVGSDTVVAVAGDIAGEQRGNGRAGDAEHGSRRQRQAPARCPPGAPGRTGVGCDRGVQ